MKLTNNEKKTLLIGLISMIAMFVSMALSFGYALTYNNYIPLIVFITSCIYIDLKETYLKRRNNEECNKTK